MLPWTSGNAILRGRDKGVRLRGGAGRTRTSNQMTISRQIAKPDEGYFISMPPLIYEDLVLIGPAGAEFAGKGWVGAFRDTRTVQYSTPFTTRENADGPIGELFTHVCPGSKKGLTPTKRA
jgi:hypothetical protein